MHGPNMGAVQEVPQYVSVGGGGDAGAYLCMWHTGAVVISGWHHKYTCIAPLPAWPLASHPSVSQVCRPGVFGQVRFLYQHLQQCSLLLPILPQTLRIHAREENQGRGSLQWGLLS